MKKIKFLFTPSLFMMFGAYILLLFVTDSIDLVLATLAIINGILWLAQYIGYLIIFVNTNKDK